MVIKVKSNPPIFGSSVKRFGKITVHPNLDPNGLYTTRPHACDPAYYHPQPMHKIFEINKNRKSEKDPWMYKQELEQWARNLGYRNQKILDSRRWQESLLGAAWHSISEPLKYVAACNNVGFSRTPRSKPSKCRIPGPGTYFKPVPFRAPYGPHSTRPTLEREQPCRFPDTSPKWSLAPDRYKIIDHECIEQKSKKLVSRRGPYDLFTGKRDSSTIKNHFNTSLKCTSATWPLALTGSFEKYKKSNFGEMNKTNRTQPHRGRNSLVDLSMCVKRSDEPGPAHLNLDVPKIFKQNKKAFNSSYEKPPGYKRAIVWPGVGRYKLKGISCGIIGHGHRHVFLSKVDRTIGAIIQEPMNSF